MGKPMKLLVEWERPCEWRWRLIANFRFAYMEAHPTGPSYTTKVGAIRAARRFARKHGIEIEE